MELPTEHVQPTDPARVTQEIEKLIAEGERFVSLENRKQFLEIILNIRRTWNSLGPATQKKAALEVSGELVLMLKILEMLKVVEERESQGLAPGAPGTQN
jgi:hypothetical protein